MTRTVIRIQEDIFDNNIEHIWSLLSSFGAIKAWMPSVKWCKTNGRDVGSVRTLMSLAGVVEEKLEVLDSEAHYISYRILDHDILPMKGGFGSWKLENIGEDKTKVKWTADAEEIDANGVATMATVYEAFMKESMEGLKKALT